MKCIFCGKSAGFFKREHPECRAIAESAKKYLRECIDYIYTNRDCMNISEVVTNSISQYHIPQAMADDLFMECWNAKVLEAFEDGVLEDDELKILREMCTALNIDRKKLSESPQWKMLMAHGKDSMMNLIDTAIKNKDFSTLKERIAAIENSYGFSKETIKQYALEAWKRVLDKAFEDGILDRYEERLLTSLANFFDFSESEIKQYNEKIVKGAILREVMEGITPNRLNISGKLPVVLQNKETVIWISNNVWAYEDKIRRHYVGGSTGVSVRVAKGVYLRSGSFKGYPVETTETVQIGRGSLIITNKHLFWLSPSRSIKIPAKKIISVIPCSDGIILQKDGVSAKPFSFIVDDPWFVCNLISNLNLLQ